MEHKQEGSCRGSHTQLTKVTLSRSLHLTFVGLHTSPRWPALCNPAPRRSSRSTELCVRLGICNRVMERGRGRLLCLPSCLLSNVNSRSTLNGFVTIDAWKSLEHLDHCERTDSLALRLALRTHRVFFDKSAILCNHPDETVWSIREDLAHCCSR